MGINKDKMICIRVNSKDEMVIRKIAEKRKTTMSDAILSVMKEEYFRQMSQKS